MGEDTFSSSDRLSIRLEGRSEPVRCYHSWRKRLLVKTKFYGDEKKYGVEDGFLWSDVSVDEVKEGNKA